MHLGFNRYAYFKTMEAAIKCYDEIVARTGAFLCIEEA